MANRAMCCCTCPILSENDNTVMPDENIIPYPYKGQDLTGKRFNRITVLGFIGRSKSSTGTFLYHYKCKCDCGKEVMWLYSEKPDGGYICLGCGKTSKE